MRNNSTSPFRSGVYTGEDASSIHVKRLEQENEILVQENTAYRNRIKKVNELEDRIQLVLKHNGNLLNENEQLSRLLNQRKAESELLKSKYEAVVVQSSTSSQIQIKKLKNEIEKLNNIIIEMQQLKKMEVSDLKSQLTQEIQYVKKGNLSSLQAADFEFRKLKEICDSKDYEISELTIKMNRVLKDTQHEILRLKDEKDRLKKQIEIQQEEHRRDVNNLKIKFDSNLHLELENLKKQHHNQVDALTFENSKLKDLVATKSAEIEQILGKNLKTKQNYEQEILLLKRENESVKDKLLQIQRISQLQIANLREKLENMRQSEISLLKSAHTNQTQILANQVRNLQDIITSKNQEIEKLFRDRKQSEIIFKSEIDKLKAELAAAAQDIKDAQENYELNLARLEKQIKAKDEQNKILDLTAAEQIATLKKELDVVKDLLEKKIEQLETLSKNASDRQKALNKQIRQLQHKLQQSQDELQKSKGQSSSQITDIKKLNEAKIHQLNQQIKSLEESNQQKDGIIQTLKKTIAQKDEALDTQEKNAASLERSIAKLRKDLQQTKKINSNKQQEHNRITKEQRQRMTASYQFEITNIRNQYNNQISGLKLQISDLKKDLQNRTMKLDDLSKKYQALVKQTKRVLGDEANRKQLDIKQPGWLPDTIATKGLFDVFMKNKVIEWCDI